MRNSLLAIAAILCGILGLAIAAPGCGCADDDDDDDEKPECDTHEKCDDQYSECQENCETEECLTDICDPAYRDCLPDDSCKKRYLECTDTVGDWEGNRECFGKFSSCLIDQCGYDDGCMGGCTDIWADCAEDSGYSIIGNTACFFVFIFCSVFCAPFA